MSIEITKTVDLRDVEVTVEVELEEVLEDADVSEVLDELGDTDAVKEWLLADQTASGIASWVADDDDMVREVLKRVKGDEQLLAMATDVLNLEDVAPKEPLLTDGDYELVITALVSIASECQRIGAMASNNDAVRDAFQQTAETYRKLTVKIESRS
jgi:hypothetical protein